jgi:Raf kinase inhibitor-like YbhB/YbcL family protein
MTVSGRSDERWITNCVQCQRVQQFQDSKIDKSAGQLSDSSLRNCLIHNAVMHLYSPEFLSGTSIPNRYTCNGEDVSPPLTWDDPPAKAQSFALIVRDRDAPGGIFTHWVLYNLPANRRELPESLPTEDVLPQGGYQGQNDFGNVGFGGPCPLQGTHRYFFKLYALDAQLDIAPGAKEEEVLKAMQDHTLTSAELMGLYGNAPI